MARGDAVAANLNSVEDEPDEAPASSDPRCSIDENGGLYSDSFPVCRTAVHGRSGPISLRKSLEAAGAFNSLVGLTAAIGQTRSFDDIYVRTSLEKAQINS
jgi:hypothetical protein